MVVASLRKRKSSDGASPEGKRGRSGATLFSTTPPETSEESPSSLPAQSSPQPRPQQTPSRGGPSFFSPVRLSKRKSGAGAGWGVESAARRADEGWADALGGGILITKGSSALPVSFWAEVPPSLVRHFGVPNRLRREAWRAWAGAWWPGRPEDDDDAEGAYDAPFAAHDDASLHTQLDKDVRRTLGSMEYFKDGDGAVVLKRLLGAAAVADTRQGYVQGMNYVCAFILVAFTHGEGGDARVAAEKRTARDVEVAAYATFRGLTSLVRGYYDPGFTRLHADVAHFGEILRVELPATAGALDAAGVIPMTYAPRFLMPLFLNALPGAVAVRLWDVLLSRTYGEERRPDEKTEEERPHSREASATLLWALLAVLAVAAPALAALAAAVAPREQPGAVFVELQDAILTAACSMPSWECLDRAAPLDIPQVRAHLDRLDTEDDNNAPTVRPSHSDAAGSDEKGGGGILAPPPSKNAHVEAAAPPSPENDLFPQASKAWRRFEFNWLGREPAYKYVDLSRLDLTRIDGDTSKENIELTYTPSKQARDAFLDEGDDALPDSTSAKPPSSRTTPMLMRTFM